ncbi:MAG: RagB/SusD family nutrient uptake outer membrane protein [Tannerellaceae bacterium]|nr:RagB/SusD family nutrient uptake outer membrane protein [Tannerellaceae bacterium]
MRNTIFNIFSLLTLFFALTFSSCFDLEEDLYDQLQKEDYYTGYESLIAALLRPYEHVKWSETEKVFWLQELSGDQLVVTQKRDHWEDGGRWRMLHQHTWDTYEETNIQTWNACYGAIGYCNNMLDDITGLDYARFNLSGAIKEQHIAEMTVLRAWLQLTLLDLYGMPPLSVSNQEPFRTQEPVENFYFIEQSILDHIDKLPVYPVSNYEGRLTQAGAAMILMRLYLNASWYIGQPKWEETKKVAQDLIDGVYGTYEIVDDWTAIWNANNQSCKEVVWVFSQARQYNYDEFYYLFFMHYKAHERFGCGADFPSSYNGCHLSPSYDPAGHLYPGGLGKPFSKYPDTDIRKKEFSVVSPGTYEGLFLYGPQYQYGTNNLQYGAEEWGNYPLVFVDQVARYGSILNGTGQMELISRLLASGEPYIIKDERFSGLPSDVKSGEENSGVRIVKYPFYPSGDAALKASGLIVLRFTEVYYTLAEAEFRTGNRAVAETLLNKVRKRYYPVEEDWQQVAYPGDGSVITEQELLDEWGREFIAGKRRRPDLNRFGLFTTGTWWDKQPSAHYRRFYPIPAEAILSNPLLQRSPGYSY